MAKQKADLARESSEEAELNWKRYWEDVADGIREENPELEGELKEESKIKTDIYRDAEEALVVVEKILKNARDEIGEYENGLYGIPLDEQQRIRNRMYDSLKNAADMAEHGSVRG